MSDKNRDEKTQELYKEMIEKNKLTPTGVERSILLYQLIGSIINKYAVSSADPVTASENTFAMEKEIIIALAKEMDRNFFEGMMDATIKTAISVMKIPQVAEMTRSLAVEFLGSGNLLDAILNNAGQKPTEQQIKKNSDETGKDTESLEGLLSSFSKSSRGKKEDLN
jgi:hypothetical protein